MATATVPAKQALPWGAITLDGRVYMEQPQIYVFDQQIDFPYEILDSLRMSLPGVADFLLKGLTRDVTLPGRPGGSVDQGFRFRLWNAEGNPWYFGGGLGVFSERVIDTMCFGTAQFPYPLIPPVRYPATGDMRMSAHLR